MRAARSGCLGHVPNHTHVRSADRTWKIMKPRTTADEYVRFSEMYVRSDSDGGAAGDGNTAGGAVTAEYNMGPVGKWGHSDPYYIYKAPAAFL
jgi:hypothetical protein